MVNAADEAWRWYVAASMAQMYAVATINEIPDLVDIERQMDSDD